MALEKKSYYQARELDEKLSSISSLVLLEFSTKLDVIAPTSDENVTIFYRSAVNVPTLVAGSDKYVVICHVSAGKQMEGAESSISAYYGLTFESDSSSEDELLNNAKLLATYSVWGRFSVLFDLINSQMELELPTLPARPRSIDVMDASHSEQASER
ncbi:hypothetical protein [Allomesorhizobium alhagi]|uniref:hypothetical protein n=1 Tax=Allomesorhizobium alhagi TaxID=475067 RepID=UPI001111F44A|nr:hypothetical protein [Mesorhizobium alhagi]